VGERFGLDHYRGKWAGGGWSCGIFGNVGDHVMMKGLEVGVRRILHCDVKSAQNQAGAIHVDVIADEGVDDLHERGLDGLSVFQECYRMEARFGRRAHAANHALVEVAENFLAKSGRAAAGSVDLDVGADASAWMDCHVGTFRCGGCVFGGLIWI